MSFISFSPSALKLTSVILHLNISQQIEMLYSLGCPSAAVSFNHTTLKKEFEICLIKVDMTFRGSRREEREKGFMFVFKKRQDSAGMTFQLIKKKRKTKTKTPNSLERSECK